MCFAEFLKDQRIIKPHNFINKPLVSVMMLTYCRAHDGLLARAISSVLSQTFADFEFIIVDDGSTDGSEDIVRDFQRQDDRILYIRHEINSGLPALRVDEGILLSRADYLAFQFDDDEWSPLFLHTVIREAAEKGKRFVHCRAEYFVGGQVYHPSFPVMQPTYASLLQGNKIANVSVLLDKSVLKVSGLYDPHAVLRRTTDFDLWLRIAQIEPPFLVPEVLARVHGGHPDSIAMKASWFGYEDFMLMFQLPRSAELVAERILDYEVASLDRYVGKLPIETIDRFYYHLVLPWLNQHKEQFEKLGIQEGGMWVVETQAQYVKSGISIKNFTKTFRSKALQFGAAIRGIVGRLFRLFPPLATCFWTLYRPLCSIVTYCKEFCFARGDAWDTIPSGHQGIKDDPLVASCRSDGFLLQKSPNLQSVPFLSYSITITLNEGDLCAILLAFVPGVSGVNGSVGVEIVSPESRIVAHARMPVACISQREPTTFFFEPPIEAGEYELRVFGERLTTPVHVYELRKRMFFGLNVIRRPFCKFMLK